MHLQKLDEGICEGRKVRKQQLRSFIASYRNPSSRRINDVPELLTSGGMAVVENRAVEHFREVVHRLQKGIVVVWNASLVGVAVNDYSGRHASGLSRTDFHSA